MRNIKLILEYKGTRYAGWQMQNNAITIQQRLNEAIERITGEETKTYASSRTDAGVHALGLCVSFRTSTRIPVEKLPLAINSALPDDISVVSAQEAELDFHARFSARGKKYIYRIYSRASRSPIHRDYAWHVTRSLDFEAMKEASGHFVGRHDFSAFKATGGSENSSVRTIYSAELIKSGDLIELHISGDGFLYNMVRIIAGTLVYVGLGKIAPCEIPEIISSGDRTKAGKTAPPEGLFLSEVYY